MRGPGLTPPLFALDGVGFAYGRRAVLRGVDLDVRAGDLVGVVGPSGAGKTTLLRLLVGSLRPSSGAVHRAAGATTAYVPQVETVDWDFPLTVEQCVLTARANQRLWPWPSRAERSEVGRLLERLGVPGTGRRHIRELSGGQQQRVFLARALLRRPRLLVLDEPTSGVDVGTRHEVLHLLVELAGEGLAVVLSTHDLNGVAAHLPRLVVLRERVLADGAPAAVLLPGVLEEAFGARLDVLEHMGCPVVVDHQDRARPALRSVRPGA